ncbi:Transcriptional regulator, TetR family [Corynebacterium ciconiae DSM 44920]|uniref:TetR/AcrR family transcriptional regulator n=1 Tax=Corynebacterium ciconiae TaxID=227319 RepID=UPI00037D6466|nr:TetR/AcrR family transcriptional regulator [Corynebacterium ciconiae]WKD62191.1 Transcriptional regulator, TetR family [Corynebacterium ciconiae DSM 44920]
MATPRREAKQATRLCVRNAARHLFHQRGFQRTTVRDIAQHAGVSVGSVMAAGDKEALLVEVFDELIDEHQRALEADSPVVGTSCLDAACAAVQPFVDLFHSHRELGQAYASILVSGRHSSAVFTDLATRLVAVFEAQLREYTELDAITAHHRAVALHAAYVGMVFMWSAAPDDPPPSLTAQIRPVFAGIICP